jgi:hypothetical protein
MYENLRPTIVAASLGKSDFERRYAMNGLNTNDANKTSLYLVRRTDALLGALRMFCESRDANRRRLQFLAQSDFWEWEMDNLIYSFTNLSERQKTWRSREATTAKLAGLDIAVNAKLIRKAFWRHNSGQTEKKLGRWKITNENTRVAPVALLQEVVNVWNQLIELVSAEFVEPMQKSVVRFNIQTRRDLTSMRKTMPELGEIEE